MVTTKEGLGPSILYLNYFFLHRIRRKLNLKIQTKKVCTFTSLQNQLTSHMEFVIVLLNSDCSICVCDRSKSSSLKGGQPRNVTGVGILDVQSEIIWLLLSNSYRPPTPADGVVGLWMS